MSKMIRKQVYLEPIQDGILKQLVKETGISEAEIIRQAVNRQIAATFQKKNPLLWEEEKEFIKQLNLAGSIQGKRTWKREELYER